MPVADTEPRRVAVAIVGERIHNLEGPPAELVALLTAKTLSTRTLALLRAVVLEEIHLAAIGHGSLTVDLAPGQIRLHLHAARPRLDVERAP